MTKKKSLVEDLLKDGGDSKLSATVSPVNGTDGLKINVNRSVTDQVRRVGRTARGDAGERVPPIADTKDFAVYSGNNRGEMASQMREHDVRKYESDSRKLFTSGSSPVSRGGGRNDDSQNVGVNVPDESRRAPAAGVAHSPGSRPRSNMELPSPHRRPLDGKDLTVDFLSDRRPIRDDMGGGGGHDIIAMVKSEFDRPSAYPGVHSDFTTSLLLGLTGYPGGLPPTISLPTVTAAERGNTLAMLGNTFLPHLVLQQKQQQHAAAARLQHIQQQQLRMLHQSASSAASSGSPLLSPFALHQSAADSRVTCQLEQLWQRKYPSHSVPPAWMLYQYQDELLRDPMVSIGSADGLGHHRMHEHNAAANVSSVHGGGDIERDKISIRELAAHEERLSQRQQMEHRDREREWEREKERRDREANAEKEHFKREYFYER